MVKLLLIHYSLVKGIYGKPNKWVAQAAGGLSFLCLFSLSLFIYLLCLTQTEYWIYLNEYKKGIRSDWGIGIIGAVLIASSIIQDKYFRVNFKMKKDILIKTASFRRYHSVLYVLIYLLLLAGSVYIMIFSYFK